MRGRLGGHGAFLAGALFLLLASGLALALLTDTPAEIRLRQQLGLDAPCLVETEDSPGWLAGPPLPYGPRDELRAASLDGDIYLTGGTSKLLEYGRPSDIKGVREYVRAQSVDDFVRFDPETGE
jgi:hypothetical protein